MEPNDANELLHKYNNGTATDEEKAWVETWYNRFTDKAAGPLQQQVLEDEQQNRRWLQQQYAPPRRMYPWPAMVAAAALLVIIGTVIFQLARTRQKTVPATAVVNKTDIAPGSDKAVLTLSNGQRIVLDSAGEGQLASQSGITITKTANGQIVYTIAKDAKNQSQEGNAGYNVITTPRGGQYQVILPDGTHVWLNAASSLKSPVVFNGNNRQVELSGEACFEVTTNKTKPFKVISRCNDIAQTVDVLGTFFNINAYDDEAHIKTTLINGAAKVTDAVTGEGKVLKPGQQAAFDKEGMQVAEVDTEGAIAWKEGYFVFDEEELASIMRQVARWYNVEVEYKDQRLLSQRFSGTVSRYGHVSQVIKVLELTQAAHFTVNGNKIEISL